LHLCPYAVAAVLLPPSFSPPGDRDPGCPLGSRRAPTQTGRFSCRVGAGSPCWQITESQHGRGWKGPPWVTQPNPDVCAQGTEHRAAVARSGWCFQALEDGRLVFLRTARGAFLSLGWGEKLGKVLLRKSRAVHWVSDPIPGVSVL